MVGKYLAANGKYQQLVKDNIEYEHWMKYGENSDKELVEEIYRIICDVVCVERKNIRVGKLDYPYQLVNTVHEAWKKPYRVCVGTIAEDYKQNQEYQSLYDYSPLQCTEYHEALLSADGKL